jgi:anaerobic ribonucleoside-triphosphate reductase activating protein
MKEVINLHDMVLRTEVLGPGLRAAVWFQGCDKRCPGCMSEESRDARKGKLVPTDDIYERVVSARGIEGLTVSGGEPFLQAGALRALLERIRENTELGVIIYTGYYLAELRAMRNPDIDAVTGGLADIIIDGPYIDELNDGKSLRGSSNQGVHFLTDRYVGVKSLFGEKGRRAEVRLSPDKAFFIGIPDRVSIASFKDATGATKPATNRR